MPRHCQVTGKTPAVGNKISHAHNVSKRRFLPNLRKKRYWVPDENRFVTLTVSTHGMKIIDRVGISKVLRDIHARGERVHYGSPRKDPAAVKAKHAGVEPAPAVTAEVVAS
jgi:large subunit ribosomal protein L28